MLKKSVQVEKKKKKQPTQWLNLQMQSELKNLMTDKDAETAIVCFAICRGMSLIITLKAALRFKKLQLELGSRRITVEEETMLERMLLLSDVQL